MYVRTNEIWSQRGEMTVRAINTTSDKKRHLKVLFLPSGDLFGSGIGPAIPMKGETVNVRCGFSLGASGQWLLQRRNLSILRKDCRRGTLTFRNKDLENININRIAIWLRQQPNRSLRNEMKFWWKFGVI